MIAPLQEVKQFHHGIGNQRCFIAHSRDVGSIDLDVGLLSGFHKLVDGAEILLGTPHACAKYAIMPGPGGVIGSEVKFTESLD